MFSRLENALWQDQRRTHRAMLTGRMRRVVLRAVAAWLLGLAALVCYEQADEPWSMMCMLVLCGFIAVGAMAGLRAARMYRDGWVDGRQDAINSMPPLLNGQITPEEWQRQQMSRTAAALGAGNEAICRELDEADRRAASWLQRYDNER